MILPRDKIRPAIREMPTIIDLRLLADAEFEMGEYDKDFVLECLSEIYWRKQDEHK